MSGRIYGITRFGRERVLFLQQPPLCIELFAQSPHCYARASAGPVLSYWRRRRVRTIEGIGVSTLGGPATFEPCAIAAFQHMQLLELGAL